MTRRPVLRAAAIAVFLLPGPARADASGAPVDTLTATVRAVEEDAVQLITGFHLCLRVIDVRTTDDTSVLVDGEPARMGDVAPGQVVRMTCRHDDGGTVAETIDVIPPPEGDGR